MLTFIFNGTLSNLSAAVIGADVSVAVLIATKFGGAMTPPNHQIGSRQVA
jgi:hypothetical protein